MADRWLAGAGAGAATATASVSECGELFSELFIFCLQYINCKR